MRFLVGAGLAVGAAAAYLVARGHTDPTTWPEAAKGEVDLLKKNLNEALAAGRRAAARREDEIDREITEAAGPG